MGHSNSASVSFNCTKLCDSHCQLTDLTKCFKSQKTTAGRLREAAATPGAATEAGEEEEEAEEVRG